MLCVISCELAGCVHRERLSWLWVHNSRLRSNQNLIHLYLSRSSLAKPRLSSISLKLARQLFVTQYKNTIFLQGKTSTLTLARGWGTRWLRGGEYDWVPINTGQWLHLHMIIRTTVLLYILLGVGYPHRATIEPPPFRLVLIFFQLS